MSQGWSKIFNRINWLNRPSTNTPLNATNLNAGDSAIDKLDDRIITLDTVKADMQVVNDMVADVSLNSNTGVITVTYKNGSHVDYDTNLEKIAVNFSYDYVNQRLVLTLTDGSKQYVDMSALITQYEFEDSATIAFSINDKTGAISAFIKNGSITDAMLETGYLAKITEQSAKATNMANSATTSSNSAYDNAKLSQSYAIGGSGVRDGEDTDNSKYYSEQASKSAIASANSASTASTKASEAESSASSASASATKSATSESNASKSASSAATSMSTANTKASEAAQSATSAGNSASTATSKAAAASTSASNAATSEANAKKYYEQAKAISESFSGALRPMGTVTFANLPSVLSASAGDMYNISDEFVTTSDFVEGIGHTEPAGSNVYKTESGKWDVLAGSPVTGVKGEKDKVFGRGNVNITCASIGALPTDGDSQDNTVTFTSNDSLTGDSTPPALLTSGETHASILSKVSTIFKNVRWLLSKMGTTDISAIGNGTVTGALSTLDSNKQDSDTAITTSNIGSQTVYQATHIGNCEVQNVASGNKNYYLGADGGTNPIQWIPRNSMAVGYANNAGAVNGYAINYIEGKGTLGSSAYVAKGDAYYIRFGNVVILYCYDLIITPGTNNNSVIVSNLPASAKYFGVQRTNSGNQTLRFGMDRDGKELKVWWDSFSTVDGTNSKPWSFEIVYLCK
jgi:hypothetical protein